MAQTDTAHHLDHIAKAMKDIDFVMLNTHTKGGRIGARPMSNNRQVDYDGDSYYFTWEKSRMVEDIEADPNVGLSLQGKGSPDGAPGIFIAIEGEAKIVRDKAAFAEHWVDELDRWFEDGIDTDGVVMLHVAASRAAYWDGEDEGDFEIA
ncbi:pyridoxamine 5'-phosphate oxidase family protein [Croceicoccus sp. YJ47]|uniref:pyridoxamine 5'-phosphate oxidase family protein n=1 Tax=Croceicoccus sp. YJ47 TaxID=2798724 RepID=UPI00192220A0|nr:pyridoxamine 5'-phosphate oxidase family protein [Croceicoccus sp. YJ47]QQN72948.1 pyridoxamine 5'-phosphate oxidase family protein [Croceicoccus sp. YJ47]